MVNNEFPANLQYILQAHGPNNTVCGGNYHIDKK